MQVSANSNYSKNRLKDKKVLCRFLNEYKFFEDPEVAVIMLQDYDSSNEIKEIDPKSVGNFKDEIRISFRFNSHQREFEKSKTLGITKDIFDLILTVINDNIDRPILILTSDEVIGKYFKNVVLMMRKEKIVLKYDSPLYNMLINELEI